MGSGGEEESLGHREEVGRGQSMDGLWGRGKVWVVWCGMGKGRGGVLVGWMDGGGELGIEVGICEVRVLWPKPVDGVFLISSPREEGGQRNDQGC